MKRILATIALMAASIACAVPAPYPVTVNSRAQTAPPVVAYAGNETVYRVSFTDGDTASAIGAGEVPFFAWATNNSASVNSTSIYSIVAGYTGVVDFTFSPAAVNFDPGRYIYETGVRGSNGNTRVYRQGTFQIYGSPVGSGVAAVTWTTNMNWEAINWQNLPAWLSTPAVTPAQTSGWVTASHDGFITTNDADRIVFNALSTNRVTRWYDPELATRWAEWDGGTNIVIYKATVIGTNFVVNLSANFEEMLTHTKPSWVNEQFPVEGSLSYWTCVYSPELSKFILSSPEFEGPIQVFWESQVYAGTIAYPVALLPQANAQGTATVSIASFNLATNIEYRYFLPTNAIPPELANLDNLQGWLNNLYAMKSVVDGHITDGTHTNVTLAGTVTIGGESRTNWPAGTPGATNLTVGASSVPYDADTRTFDATGIIRPNSITNGQGGFTVYAPSGFTGAEIRESGANAGRIKMGVINLGPYSLSGIWANTADTNSATAAFAQDSSANVYFSSPSAAASVYFGFAGSYWPMSMTTTKLTLAIPMEGTSASFSTFLKLTPTADPPSAAEGVIYADTDHHLYYYDGSNWKQLDN